MAKFLLGILSGVVLTVLTVLAMILVAATFGTPAPSVEEDSVLTIRLQGEVPEYSRTDFSFEFMRSGPPPTLLDLRDTLHHAAGDDRIRLAEVCLGMARGMLQRHEHLPPTASMLPHVVLHDRVATVEPVLFPQTLENPLRRVMLLAMARAVLIQILIDDPDIGIQLWSLHPCPAAITRRLRMPEHLPHRLSGYAKPARSFALA
ncbi:MAG: hypothetical protein IH897_11775 [Planctomycetes bacterium]|nr:hypothetical protein [Planctomycetota bacterium]